MNDLVWYASLTAIGLSAYWGVRRHEISPLLWTALPLGVLLGLLVQARGEEDLQRPLVMALYVMMIMGMLAHYAYERFQSSRGRRRKFGIGVFLAPVFVSPIVFLPLASIFQTTEPVQASASRLMLFLVAFENGFFWREFFENRMGRAAEGDNK